MRTFPFARVFMLAAALVPLAAAQERSPLSWRDNFHAISPGRAYRSAQLDAGELRWVIERYGIQAVINLRGIRDKRWYRQEQAACRAAGVRMIDIPMSERRLPPRETLLAIYDTFRSESGPILIHCKYGSDRTGAAAAIWRMVVAGETRERARRELSSRFGHSRLFYPKMDELVRVFEPDRGWIERDYRPE